MVATYQKRGRSWRVQIRLRGVSLSREFSTKQAAQAWATERENDIRQGKGGDSSKTLSDALEAFQRDVSPKRRGSRWEGIRLTSWRGLSKKSEGLPFLAVPMLDLRPEHFADWRDARLRHVSGSTVRREFALMSAVLEWARLEKRWLPSNPLKDVRKPASSKERQRLITDDEARRIVLALGYTGGKPENVSQQVALVFLIALETGMRASEIIGMTWENLNGSVAHVPLSKNGHARNVPMSAHAVSLWERMERGEGKVFSVNAGSRDALFRRAVKACEIEGLTFHDARATALTRLSKKVDVLTLARISGHRDVGILGRVYYRESAEDIAKRL